MPLFPLFASSSAQSIIENLSAEDTLLLLCLRKVPDSDKRESIEAVIGKGIDWKRLIETSLRHALLPVLHRTLEILRIEEIPVEIKAQLKDYFRKNALRNLVLTGELLKLINLFEMEGIPCIPYKGSTLAVLLYGDLSLRQFDDIDILVHKENVLKAKEILVAYGYRPDSI